MRNGTRFVSKAFALALASAVGGHLSACYADNGLEEVAEENLAEAEGAFGESTCSTTATATYTHVGAVGCSGYWSGSGNDWQPACTHGYIVDADGIYEPGTTLRVAPRWDDEWNTQNRCEKMYVNVIRYHNGWQQAIRNYHGVWSSASNSCSLVETYGRGLLPVLNGDRFVAQAYWDDGYTPTDYRTVKVVFVDPLC